MTPQLPLLKHHSLNSIIAYKNSIAVTAGEFIAHAQQLAARLPGKEYVINLCDDRYYFLLTYAASLIRHQTTLLPPTRARDVIDNLCHEYPDGYILSENPSNDRSYESVDCRIEQTNEKACTIPLINAKHKSVILYTSGSSGIATPHLKLWETLVQGASLTGDRLNITKGMTLLATVPPQHMFGLETSVVLPLQYGCAIDNQRPLFPADIASALSALPTPRALITTPLQLRACATAQQPLPELEFILSATAPLSQELAHKIEAQCSTQVKEIYGSTETGAIATRDTATETSWLPLPTIELSKQANDRWLMKAPHIPEPQFLSDQLKYEGHRFSLLGRSGDLIKVAGKRVSLGDLNHILLSIDGVIDGHFFLPEESDIDNRTTRLTAVVATDEMNEKTLTEALRLRIDTAFLPRPLIIVDKLPRNETGKLPLKHLMTIFNEHKKTGQKHV